MRLIDYQLSTDDTYFSSNNAINCLKIKQAIFTNAWPFVININITQLSGLTQHGPHRELGSLLLSDVRAVGPSPIHTQG